MKNWHPDNSGCLYAQTQLDGVFPQSEIVTMLIDVSSIFDIVDEIELNRIIQDFGSINEFLMPAFYMAEHKSGFKNPKTIDSLTVANIANQHLVIHSVLDVLSDCIMNHYTPNLKCLNILDATINSRKNLYGNITEGTLYVRGEFAWYPSAIPVLNSQ